MGSTLDLGVENQGSPDAHRTRKGRALVPRLGEDAMSDLCIDLVGHLALHHHRRALPREAGNDAP
jgi:hypothetical protein